MKSLYKHCKVLLVIVGIIISSEKISAQTKEELFPETHKLINPPSKTTSSTTLNNFVNQSFDFYAQTNKAKSGLEMLITLVNTDGTDISSLPGKAGEIYEALAKLLPLVESLVSRGPDLYNSVKDELKILEYPRALSNIKTSVQALYYAAGDLKFMITKTIPRIKQLTRSKKADSSDGMPSADTSYTADSLNVNQ